MKTSSLLALLALTLSLMNASSLAAAPTSRHFVNREGMQLHFLDAGQGPRTIVFIPGWLMPAAIFRLQLEALSDEFRVLAFDPRSQGGSRISTGPHNPARRLNDIEDFLRAAAVEEYVLAGWSLGVLESLDFIAQKPAPGLRGLILIDNSIGEGKPPTPAGNISQRNSPDPETRKRYLQDFSRSIFGRPPPADIAQAVLQSALQVPERAARQLLAQPYERSYWRNIVARQDIPVLYAIRPRFRDQGEALLARKCEPLAQVAMFEQAGHALFVDEAERFNELARAFARRAFRTTPDAAPLAPSDPGPSSGN